jgi:hypothetical protein
MYYWKWLALFPRGNYSCIGLGIVVLRFKNAAQEDSHFRTGIACFLRVVTAHPIETGRAFRRSYHRSYTIIQRWDHLTVSLPACRPQKVYWRSQNKSRICLVAEPKVNLLHWKQYIYSKVEQSDHSPMRSTSSFGKRSVPRMNLIMM